MLAATDTSRFLVRTGHFPRTHSDDAAEAQLGTWIQHQRRALKSGTLKPQRLATLDQMMPGWQGERADLDGLWRSTLCSLAAHVERSGGLPAARNLDPATRALRKWLERQRYRDAKGALDATRRARLDAVLPGWRSGASWVDTAALVAAFETGRGPAGTTLEMSSPVRRRNWIVQQPYAAKSVRLSALRASQLDRLLPGWRSGRADAWDRNLSAVVAFRLAQGQWPRYRSCGSERSLYGWLGRQCATARSGRLSSERRAQLDQLLPGWEARGDCATPR